MQQAVAQAAQQLQALQKQVHIQQQSPLPSVTAARLSSGSAGSGGSGSSGSGRDGSPPTTAAALQQLQLQQLRGQLTPLGDRSAGKSVAPRALEAALEETTDLEELEQFAKTFKQRRIKLGKCRSPRTWIQ